MLALAAALLSARQASSLPGLEGCAFASFATRPVPASFEVFDREVLLAVVRPAVNRRIGLTVVGEPEVLQRHAACTLGALRQELASWVQALTAGSPAELRRLEAMATAGLLRRSDIQCAYRLAPLTLPDARPLVLVQQQVLDGVGRPRFLRALWESEIAVGAGADQEFGALYDEFAERLKRHLGRMGDARAGGA